jgi:glucan 1,3-beta-glucosidase
MTDLTFNGGQYGAFFGNQQFTTRNMTFNNCQTAIFMNWNWLWTFKSLSINNCRIGIDIANGGAAQQTVGSVLVQDSKFSNTPIGISSVHNINTNNPATGGTLIIDNCDFTTSAVAVSNPAGGTILGGNTVVASWAQGRQYVGAGTSPAVGSNIQGAVTATKNPGPLLDSTGAIFSQSKPQYENYPSTSFLSAKSHGCKGDGKTDDTAALQTLINNVAAATGQAVAYIDHGAYIITSTITVPPNVIIVGELWPQMMASGPTFSNPANPQPLFRIGEAGSTGFFEMSDIIFSTAGPAPGAILIEWNLHDPAGQQGASAMWDVHFRIGGAAGTGMQSSTCAKTPTVIPTVPNPACEGAFLLLHITSSASAYIENSWFWVADHELDLPDHGQINIYNGRGVLIESEAGPVWLVGTASEHSTLYNYQLHSAMNVYLGTIQGETAYFQSNPSALLPFMPNASYNDPVFAECQGSSAIGQAKFTYNPRNSSGASNSSYTSTNTSTSAPVQMKYTYNPSNSSGTSNSTFLSSSTQTLATAPAGNCEKTWGLRILESSNIVMFGAGLYSFFDNYDQTCLNTSSCQANMVDIRNSTNLALWGLSTKASSSMVSIDGEGVVDQSANTDNFCSTLALFEN